VTRRHTHDSDDRLSTTGSAVSELEVPSRSRLDSGLLPSSLDHLLTRVTLQLAPPGANDPVRVLRAGLSVCRSQPCSLFLPIRSATLTRSLRSPWDAYSRPRSFTLRPTISFLDSPTRATLADRATIEPRSSWRRVTDVSFRCTSGSQLHLPRAIPCATHSLTMRHGGRPRRTTHTGCQSTVLGDTSYLRDADATSCALRFCRRRAITFPGAFVAHPHSGQTPLTFPVRL